MKTDETFGERLKRLRKSRGITSTTLGAAAGIEANSIFRLESGTSKEPGFLVGIRLCEALGVSPHELAFGKARTPEITLHVGETTVMLEVRTPKSVDAARRRAIVDMIGAALAKLDGMEVQHSAAQSAQMETEEPSPKDGAEIAVLSRTVDELHATVSSLSEALTQVQKRLAQLEGKPAKRPKAKPSRRKPR